MNNPQLTAKALRILSERRYAAEEKAEQTLEKLRQNPQWTSLEGRLRSAQVDLAMGFGNSAELQSAITAMEAEQKALLHRLGVADSELRPQYSCAKCGDTGYVNGTRCSCLEAEIRKLILSDSNIINRGFTFEASTETDKHNVAVIKKARQLCTEGNFNLLLCGHVGCGKTYLLTACANLAAQLNRSVLFVTAYSLNNTFLKAHLGDIATRESTMDSLIDVDLLLIDDLGTENVYKNVTAEYFFALLNERLVNKKQTFITTNLSLTEIRNRYDERMFSRLVDQNITVVAELRGEDKRLKKR